MPEGTVKWFNADKGFGFIAPNDGGDDLFVHFSAITMEGYKTLKAGQPVTFEKKPSDKGVHAVNIVPQEMPQRQDKSADDHSESGPEDRSENFQDHQQAVNG